MYEVAFPPAAGTTCVWRVPGEGEDLSRFSLLRLGAHGWRGAGLSSGGQTWRGGLVGTELGREARLGLLSTGLRRCFPETRPSPQPGHPKRTQDSSASTPVTHVCTCVLSFTDTNRLRCTVQWPQADPWCCVTFTTFQNLFIFQTEAVSPLTTNSPSPLPPVLPTVPMDLTTGTS